MRHNNVDKIKFGTAQIAKQKGIELSSEWFYDNGKLRLGSGTGYGYQQFQKGVAIYAPLQYQLQTFLRIKYEIDIWIIGYNEYRIEYDGCENEHYGVFTTYEEVLESALVVALSLLEDNL